MEFQNKHVCSKCKGVCCTHMGCHYSPDDFKNKGFEALKREIDKGYISIDWWENFELNGQKRKGYYLRIRNLNANVVDPSWGGTCMLLTKDGCPLEFKDRPKGARALIPSKNRCCTLYTKYDAAVDWSKHIDVLDRLYDHYMSED